MMTVWTRGIALSIIGTAILGFNSGCATPDLKPFAKETAALAGSISAEQTEVATHFEQVRGLADAFNLDRNTDVNRVKRLKAEKQQFEHNAVAVDAVMDLAVTYSTTLADLAASGEDGPKAVTSLSDTLTGFSSALNSAFPVPGDIPGWAKKLTEELAQCVTRIQAQNGLVDAMKVADPTIRQIADSIVEIYRWPKGAQASIDAGLQSTEEGVLRDTMGKNRIALYSALNFKHLKLGNHDPKSRLEYFFGAVADRIAHQNPTAGICGITGRSDDKNCLTDETLQGLQAIVSLLSVLEPQFQAYSRDLAASRKWLEERKATSRAIADAATAWAAEHNKIAKQFAICGGLRAFGKSCANVRVSSFAVAVARVTAIASKGAKQ